MEERAIKKVKKNPEKWHHFLVISSSQAILRGNSSTSNKRFKILSRNRQASAVSVVGIVYAHLLKPWDWTASFLDRILEDGDKLFRVSQARNRLKKNVFMTPNLLQQQFFVGDYKCKICTEIDIICGNLINETAGALDLKRGLHKFLETPNFGILTSQGNMMYSIYFRLEDNNILDLETKFYMYK
jgi:hypothetical protein